MGIISLLVFACGACAAGWAASWYAAKKVFENNAALLAILKAQNAKLNEVLRGTH